MLRARQMRRTIVLLLAVAVLAGLVQPVSSAPAVAASAVADDPGGEPPRPMPGSEWKEWDGKSGVGDLGDPRYRRLVADLAQLDEDVEVREAAAVALNGDSATIMTFLRTGVDEARARATARKQETARQNRAKIEALVGQGGPYFRGEVTRVLAGTDYDRECFLAYGAEIAKMRDEQAAQLDRDRLATLRARVQMLADVGSPEVQKAARAALVAGDAAIAEFLNNGYLVAAKKDAADREAYLKEQEERQKAADQLSELAKRAARASQARKNLLIAHGEGVRALQRAANAMISAGNEARRAAQILAANEAGGHHSPDSFADAKREVARQLGYAGDAATAAQQAAARATVEANVLVEVNLPYGSQWARMAQGMAAAAQAAVSASQTAQHTIDATAATDAARDAQEKAERHAEEAHRWRLHAEEHARSAAQLAEAARLQAIAAQDAAARAHQARLEAEEAERQAWAAAARTHQARLTAEDEQRKAAAARQVAERERATAASERAKAEQEAANARIARGEADRQAGIAHTAMQNAQAKETVANQAADGAQAEERNAAAARDRAYGAEQARQSAEAKAQAMESAAARARGTEHADAANRAAADARTEANIATQAARDARAAADNATGAAVRARGHATEATQAAARARAAANEAQYHAARANQAANEAEALAAATHAFALQANAKAAEATVAEAQAAEHARAAVQLAEQAASEARLALQAADRTRAEADAAAAESVSAATQAGIAVRASQAARASSNAIIEPANTAISVVAPFTGADIDADFVTEVANQAKLVGAEQAKAAADRAAEAELAAQRAREAADRAAGEVKPAYEAAAAAAASAAAAARSAADAQKAAADAAIDGAAARAAGERANQADAQARADAVAARAAANQANSDAAIAGRAADAAERDAAAARDAASRAEADAAAAQDAARRAEADAAAARAAADRAQEAANRATQAAQNAMGSATAAQQAADRAEDQARRDEAERRRQVAGQLDPTIPDLTPDEIEMLTAAGGPELVQQYRDGLAAANKTVVEFLVEIGAEVLNGLLGITDAKRCFGEGNIASCLWTVINIGSFLAVLGKLPAVTTAIARVVGGLAGFLSRSRWGRGVLEEIHGITICVPVRTGVVALREEQKGRIASEALGDSRSAAACPNIWNFVNATQEVWEGTKIPQSFELTTQAGVKIWVHPNGSKHIRDFVLGKAVRPEMRSAQTAVELASLWKAVSIAARNGIKFDEMIVVAGWELKFGPPKTGPLPALFHARYVGF